MTSTIDEQSREKWIRFLQSLNPDIPPKAARLSDELSYVMRAIHHIGQQDLDQLQLSFAQYRVLIHLFFAEKVGDRCDLNPSEISERQRVSRNAISSLIRNLEDEALVERQLDPNDRRRFNISLTEKGRALVQNHASHHFHTIADCFAVLSPDEQETLSHLLRKVGESIDARSIEL